MGKNFVFGEMSPTGVVTDIPIAKFISGIVSNGPTGSLIVTGITKRLQNEVFEVSTAGAVARYKIPAADSNGGLVYLGPADGSNWFADQSSSLKIVQSPVSGVASAYTLPSRGQGGLGSLGSMAVGQDGNLYVLNYGFAALGDNTTIFRLTPSELSKGR